MKRMLVDLSKKKKKEKQDIGVVDMLVRGVVGL